MFHLEDVDRRINSTRDLCYTQMGKEGGMEAAYIEYEVKSNCANLPEVRSALLFQTRVRINKQINAY